MEGTWEFVSFQLWADTCQEVTENGVVLLEKIVKHFYFIEILIFKKVCVYILEKRVYDTCMRM